MKNTKALIFSGRNLRAIADLFIGVTYKFGAEAKIDNPKPKALDCSELMQLIFFQAFKMKIVDGSYNQYRESRGFKLRNPKIGDFFFQTRGQGVGHVGLFITPNIAIEASSVAKEVRYVQTYKILERKSFLAIGRYKDLPGIIR